ncbi:uncharacterized protein F4807DRAFT_449398 [Annulohypoxylon truncatum]|uniref:uncharacterized protein n=1 Tax=Annulohypoxylon truncatum TaxID=327061 RepID=UPI0020074072|nr:uncharacterized protein F4807DRAFT_449398 [Annulohypoxylon truncatum]KAI1215123.1 hypothetical protein F4807DRAFT_449398 [Annulohypoxylon truncatum]
MPFHERQGGWGVGQRPNPPTNPFANPTPTPSQPVNPFAQIPPAASNAPNPFLQKQPNGAVPAPNPFLTKRANPFANSTSTAQNNPFASSGQSHNSAPREPKSFGKPSFGQGFKPTATTTTTSTTPNPFVKQPSPFTSGSGARSTPNTNGVRKSSEYVKPAWPTQSQKASDSAPKNQTNGKRKSENDFQRRSKFSRKSPDPEVASIRSTRDTKKDTSVAVDKPANSRREEPEKDNIKPPRWPENPGSFENRHAIERLRETHKAYRERARKSLMRAGLIDDPDKKRRLDEALVFKGICEEMCPEWEQITRIGTDDRGELVPMPELMDAPLPMDVRSVNTLRKTLVYLTHLIESDDLLPQRHSFLWDRTRAIRIDFSFQKYAMTPAEIKDQIYCLETIARFHVTSLHLLSRSGFTPVDFSEQQEVEQLSKTLISLMENEAEFRGYFIDWDRRFGDAQGIKSAIFITECIKNVQRLQGPLHPESNTQMTTDVASSFFEFIKSPLIHFNTVRKAVVKLVKRSCSRPRFGPKDLTPAILKQYLYTDTEEEAVDFFTKHGFQFDDDGNYLVLLPHPFSGDIVERKRCGQPFAVVVHSTVSELDFAADSHMIGEVNEGDDENDNLFVTDSQSASSDSNEEGDSEAQDSESGESAASPRPLPAMLGNHVVTRQNTAAPVEHPSTLTGQSTAPTFGQPNIDSKLQESPSVPTSTTLGQIGTSIFAQPSKDSGAQSTSFIPSSTAPSLPSTSGTTPFGSLTSASDSWPQKPQTQSTVSAPKTVRFDDRISFGHAPTPTDKATATPGVFGFPNNNGGDKGAATSSALPSASPFPGPLSNKEGSQLQFSSVMSTTLSPVGSPVQPTITSLPAFPASTATQPAAPEVENPFAASQSSTVDVPTIAPPGSSLKEASATLAPDFLSKTPPQKTAQRDLMGDFTKWFVCGDKGLMESQLEELAVEYILKDTWQAFQEYEEKRAQKEEEERLLAEAREFREKSLKVKFFYRWKDGFRKRQRIRRMRMEMEKGRQWKLPENVAKRERAEKDKQAKTVKEAKDSMLKRSRRNVQEAAHLRHSARSSVESRSQSLEDGLDESQLETSSRQSRIEYIEDQLLATGVFNGVRDERAAARYAAMGSDPEFEKEKNLEMKIRLRAENHDRLKRGLRPLKALPEPKVHKEGSKTAMLRAQCRLAERGASLYKSTGSFRSSPFSSSYRSSLGYNSNRVSKSRSRVTDPYWRLKANGLVRMPNGEYLHESIALPILQGDQRTSGLGNYGVLPIESTTPVHSPPPLPSGFFSPPSQTDGLVQSRDTPSSGGSQKRKRTAGEEELASVDFGTPPSMKRIRSEERDSPSVTNAEAHLADIESLMKKVNGFRSSISKKS